MQNQSHKQHSYAQLTHAPYGNSSMSIQPNLAALLSYLLVPITSIIFLVMEKENRLVRFHAMQSLLYGAALVIVSIALSIVLSVITSIIGQVSTVLAAVAALVSLFVWLGLLVAMLGTAIWCMVKAYQGVMYKLPVVGNMAQRMTAV